MIVVTIRTSLQTYAINETVQRVGRGVSQIIGASRNGFCVMKKTIAGIIGKFHQMLVFIIIFRLLSNLAMNYQKIAQFVIQKLTLSVKMTAVFQSEYEVSYFLFYNFQLHGCIRLK